MRNELSTLQVDAIIYSSGNGDQTDLEIYYKLCTEGDCYFTGEEAGGVGAVERLVTIRTDAETKLDKDEVETSFTYSAQILHDPNDCEGTSYCKYTFSTYNPSPLS